MSAGRVIRVLIVDDSAIVRKVLTETLSKEPDLEVVGTAPDPYVARDKILALKPDVLTLDIEMPRMDGLTFLQKLMQFHPMPVVIISSLAQPSCRVAIAAMESGAVEVLAKPGGPYSVGELQHVLANKIRAAAAARLRFPPPGTAPAALRSPTTLKATSSRGVIAIGASTGGTEAIASVLRVLPKGAPGVVVVQHIPPVFSRAFASRLDEICEIDVKEAQDGDVVRPGLALVSPGDFHMVVRRGASGYFVNVKTGPRVCYQRPSVDVLFFSVAEAIGPEAVGALLTGMGADGAQGLLRMRNAGARTIAQNEATCVVFGMPREAIQLGAAQQVVPLDRIAHALMEPASGAHQTPRPAAPASTQTPHPEPGAVRPF
ncbi:MAG: chemotaxis response regulator protein-glutamate methylesterase [Terriglobia bacterium]|nr:MAG: chemotaxis response regulator protein-glutamate methylesterase [Terriglobia bacterium]